MSFGIFDDQSKLVSNLSKAYQAVKDDNRTAIMSCRDTFVKEAAGIAVTAGTRIFAGQALDSLLSGTPLSFVGYLVTEVLEDKVSIATAVVNGLAAAALTVYDKSTPTVSPEDLVATIHKACVARREAEKAREDYCARVTASRALANRIVGNKKTKGQTTLTREKVASSRLHVA